MFCYDTMPVAIQELFLVLAGIGFLIIVEDSIVGDSISGVVLKSEPCTIIYKYYEADSCF